MPDPVPVTRMERLLNNDDIQPVTRLEQFLAGDDLEPVTRMEWFLKKAALGSGHVYSDEFTVSGATTTSAVFKTIELTPEAVTAVVVVVKAKNPTSGQFLRFAGSTVIPSITANNSTLSKSGSGTDGTSAAATNNTGIFLSTSSLTGAPSAPKLTLKLSAKKGSTTFTKLDGTYTVDVYVF